MNQPKEPAHKPAAKPADADGKATRKKKGTATFTPRQGQFLAFIHRYQQLHRQAPAELDFAFYFRVTPPSVHGMVVTLTNLGLITR
jgi:hypothetical protein